MDPGLQAEPSGRQRVLQAVQPGPHDSPGTRFPQDAHGQRTLGGLPGGNWTLPSKAEIETLIQGRGNVNGPHWLHDKARMNLNQTNAAGGLAYMSRPDGWSSHTQPTRFANDHRLEIFRYNLWTGGVVREEIRWCAGPLPNCQAELRGKLEKVKGAIFYVRPVGGDGPYWWG